MGKLLDMVRIWHWRRIYRPGRTLSRFVARDVKREIHVESADRIEEGFIVGRVRTNNVLYLSKNLMEAQDFGESVSLQIRSMWNWSGADWGGLSDGTSIVDHVETR